jgi:GMP reductase
MPQLSAIIECADAAHGMGGFIVADGGCQVPGDVSKAFAAGADFVMLGGMFAGHVEGYNDDEIEFDEKTGKHYVEFYGSSSKAAQEKHNGGVAEYRSSEGKRVELALRGSIEDTLNHILGGVRSTCTYVGARKLKELSKRTTFIRVNNAAQYNTVFGDSHEVS